jgi:hypothetical protein
MVGILADDGQRRPDDAVEAVADFPPDEAAPGVGASPRPDATGEDAGDAARRAAGADPAAGEEIEPPWQSGILPPAD